MMISGKECAVPALKDLATYARKALIKGADRPAYTDKLRELSRDSAEFDCCLAIDQAPSKTDAMFSFMTPENLRSEIEQQSGVITLGNGREVKTTTLQMPWKLQYLEGMSEKSLLLQNALFQKLQEIFGGKLCFLQNDRTSQVFLAIKNAERIDGTASPHTSYELLGLYDKPASIDPFNSSLFDNQLYGNGNYPDERVKSLLKTLLEKVHSGQPQTLVHIKAPTGMREILPSESSYFPLAAQPGGKWHGVA